MKSNKQTSELQRRSQWLARHHQQTMYNKFYKHILHTCRVGCINRIESTSVSYIVPCGERDLRTEKVHACTGLWWRRVHGDSVSKTLVERVKSKLRRFPVRESKKVVAYVSENSLKFYRPEFRCTVFSSILLTRFASNDPNRVTSPSEPLAVLSS